MSATRKFFPPDPRADIYTDTDDANRRAKRASEQRDEAAMIAWQATPEARATKGYGLAGKAILDPAPIPQLSDRDALRTRAGARVNRRAMNNAGLVDHATIPPRRTVSTSMPPLEREMRQRFVAVAKLVGGTLYPSECSDLLTEVRELARYYRSNEQKIGALGRMENRLRKVQRSVHP